MTDDWDRRCMMNILADFYCMEAVSGSYIYGESGTYRQLGAESDYAVRVTLVLFPCGLVVEEKQRE